MTSVSSAEKPTGQAWDHVWVMTNEKGQQQVLRQLATEKSRSNAVWGCGGIALLNMASVCDKIEFISVFDIGERVQELWEKLQKVIPTLDPDQLKESQEHFITWIKSEYPNSAASLEAEIHEGTSFLSSKVQLQRVCKIFQQNGHVSFTKLDFGKPKEFCAFLLTQRQKGATPHVVYISNIAQCDSGAMPNTLEGMELCQQWSNFKSSIVCIPKTAIVIDAKGTQVKGGIANPVQRIHPKDKDNLIPTIQDLFERVRLSNDYHAVTFCLKNGADTTRLVDEQLTCLSDCALFGHTNSLMAFLDSRANVDIRDPDDSTPLMRAAIGDLGNRVETIELLISRKANVHAVDNQGRTALHVAAQMGKLDACQALLEFGASRNAKDANHNTPLQLTHSSESYVYEMRGTDEYAKLQTLLKKDFPRKQPRNFEPPSKTTEAAASTAGNTLNSSTAAQSTQRVETKQNNHSN